MYNHGQMKLANKNIYLLCIDESGRPSLEEDKDRAFVLAAVVIKKSDFEIIQGYLRFIKRNYIGDDMRILHATDLMEKTYLHYRKLALDPSKFYTFLNEIQSFLRNAPYQTNLYWVNKEPLIRKVGYVKKRDRDQRLSYKKINPDLPFEMCVTEAIKDFAKLLESKNAQGEILIESRGSYDRNFIEYFNKIRESKLEGGAHNPYHKVIKERISSIVIANKKNINGALELADLCAFTAYHVVTKYKLLKAPVQKRGQVKGCFTQIQKNVASSNKSWKHQHVKELT